VEGPFYWKGVNVISVEFQLDLLKHRLKHFTKIKDKEYIACCPAHGDNNPSLAISESESGKVLLHCFSHGCSAKNIVRKAGLAFSSLGEIIERDIGPDLTEEEMRPVDTKKYDIFSWPVTKVYNYTDDEGQVVLKVTRRDSCMVIHGIEKKAFFQSSKNDQGKWINKVVSGTEIPPYNLGDIIAVGSKDTIYIVEGEKAADTLAAADRLTVTTNPGGAGRWNKISHRFKHVFAGRNIVILPDADAVGRSHAVDVALDMESVGAASIKIVDLWPSENDGKDIVDWLKEHDVDEFHNTVRDARSFQLDPSTTGFRLPCGASFQSLAHPDIVLRGRNFLVPGLVLSGSLCVLAGDGGVGKSSQCGHLAARVSQGKCVFGLPPSAYIDGIPKGNVIWISKEEGAETEILPRLISEGAALERIFVLREGNVDLDDPDSVRALLSARKPKLVILDPLTSYLSGSENENQGIRKTLEQLLHITQELQLDTAYVGLVHLNKGSGDKANGGVKQVLGSVGIPNLSRSTLMITRNEDEGCSELKVVKANFRCNTGTLQFNIKSMLPSEAERRIKAAGVKMAGNPKRIMQSFSQIEVKAWVNSCVGVEVETSSQPY